MKLMQRELGMVWLIFKSWQFLTYTQKNSQQFVWIQTKQNDLSSDENKFNKETVIY